MKIDNMDLHRFRHLLEIQRRLSGERDINQLSRLVMQEIEELLEADRGSLFLFDWEIMQLRSCFAKGIDSESLMVPLRMGIIGSAAITRKTMNVTNPYTHPYFNPEIDTISFFKTDSILAAPIQTPDGRILGGLELINKTTGHFTETDESLVESAAAQIAILAIAGQLTSATAQRETDLLKERIGYERSSVFILDETQAYLRAVHADGIDPSQLTLRIQLGIAGQVAVTRQPLLIPDVSVDNRFDDSFDRRTGYHTRNILCVPMLNLAGETIGVIQAINRKNGCFTEFDLQMLVNVAGILAITIENVLRVQEYERQFHSLLETLAASIDAKDSLTAGHSHRVAEIAIEIARILNYPEKELDVLRVAGILHDYGKIGIEDRVLKKPGQLDEEEYQQIKKHANLTFEILEKIHFTRQYKNVPLIASSHHECLDGSGYPRGLSASQIPFMSKILAVADVFEALTADRHYRPGMSIDTALAILDQGVGKKFDSHVVKALKCCLVQQKTKLS
ncbi:HD-GYP domain-containing protein [Gammaproteobacteria bacterium]